MNASKGSFLAFPCIMIAGVSNAIADELHDPATGDLAEMKTVSGQDKHGLYAAPSRSGSITNIVGLSGGPQEVGEPADSLLARLNLRPYFISLTLPNRNPEWVKAYSN